MGSWLAALVLAAAPLSFDEALRLADSAPAVDGEARAQAARAQQASRAHGLLANPQLTLQPGGRAAQQGAGPEFYGSASQSFSLSGAGSARDEALRLEGRAGQAVVQERRREARLLAAQVWFRLWAAEAVLAAARAEYAESQAWAAKVERAAKAGGLSSVDAAAARAWRAEAHLAVLAAEGEAFDTGVDVNRALGRLEAAPAVTRGGLPTLGPDGVLPLTVAGARRAPRVVAAQALVQAEAARGVEVTAQNGAWLQAGVTGGREGTGDVVGLAVLQFTLPVFHTDARERSEVDARTEVAKGAARQAEVEAMARRVAAVHEVEHTQETLAGVEGDLLPAAEDAARFALRRLEAGEGTAFEWSAARRTLFGARTRQVRAQAQVVQARFVAAELGRTEESAP